MPNYRAVSMQVDKNSFIYAEVIIHLSRDIFKM